MLINLPGTNCTVDSGSMAQRIAYDASDRTEYVGLAQPGKAADAAGWQIKKMTYDGGGRVIQVGFASGSNEFAFVWNDRESYSYS